ncbi:MAG TPA: hypothetical protein VEX15_13155 [Nocardioidaceae bacterium]|nr:hypothetical protein [Nocardioidaceae bacterium]
MTRDQARKLKLSGNLLHSYLGGTWTELSPTDQDLLDLIDGNFLLANAMLSMLAPLRRKSVDEVLDELSPRDEGIPDHPAAKPLWATTVDLVRDARGSGWMQMPQLSRVYDLPTALRNSFNVAVAVTFEFAAQAGHPPADVAKIFADAAGVGDPGPVEVDSGHFAQAAGWFG